MSSEEESNNNCHKENNNERKEETNNECEEENISEHKKENISKHDQESSNKQRGTTSSVKESGNKHEEKLEKKAKTLRLRSRDLQLEILQLQNCSFTGGESRD
ncbi:unnamed protein product [Sphagnum compactum]